MHPPAGTGEDDAKPKPDLPGGGVFGPEKPKAKAEPVQICVGLDFGTSTVKCVFQAEVGHRKREERIVLRVHKELLFPSVLWESGGKAFVGAKPAGADCRGYHSAKVCLRCSRIEDEPCFKCFSGSDLDAETVCWAILAHCVSDIRSQIAAMYPPPKFALDMERMEWKIGVPLDGVPNAPLHRAFRDLIWQAVWHGRHFKQGMGVKDLRLLYDAIRKDSCPADAESNCFALPEAVVAANAFLLTHKGALEPQLYFIADVGAGTLDVCVFRYAPAVHNPIVCYEKSCTRVGGDDFKRLVGNLLDEGSQGSQREAQRLLEEGGEELAEILCNAPEKLDEIFVRMVKGRNIAVERSRKKEKSWENWRTLRGVVIGGASKIPDVAITLLKKVSNGNPAEDFDASSFRFLLPKLENATDLHSMAIGLSIPRTRYYGYYFPDEVAPMEVVPYKPKRIDDPYRDR